MLPSDLEGSVSIGMPVYAMASGQSLDEVTKWWETATFETELELNRCEFSNGNDELSCGNVADFIC